jgi:hypothetical protein
MNRKKTKLKGGMGSQGDAMQLQSDKCPVDLGYNPMMDASMSGQGKGGQGKGGQGKGGQGKGGQGTGGQGSSEMDDNWLGKDCDNPFKKVEHPKCQYPDKPPEDYSQYEGMEKEDQMESKLECAYQKWKFEDERAKTNIDKKYLQDKRKSKMIPIIKQICHYYKPLCNTKDLMGIPKEPDERCVETISCDDKWPDLQDIPEDVKYFAKLIFDIFDFSKLKDDTSIEDSDKDDRREKAKELVKEMKELSIKYKHLSAPFPEELLKDPKCKGRSISKSSRNLSKNHIKYEHMSRCFSTPEINIIKEYIKKRDEHVKIKPSVGRRLKRLGRTIKNKARIVGKSAKQFANKKVTIKSQKSLDKISRMPEIRALQMRDGLQTDKCSSLKDLGETKRAQECARNYVTERNKGGMQLDDLNKHNMQQTVETDLQTDFFKTLPDMSKEDREKQYKIHTSTVKYKEEKNSRLAQVSDNLIKEPPSSIWGKFKEKTGMSALGSIGKELIGKNSVSVSRKEANISKKKSNLASLGVQM